MFTPDKIEGWDSVSNGDDVCVSALSRLSHTPVCTRGPACVIDCDAAPCSDHPSKDESVKENASLLQSVNNSELLYKDAAAANAL